MAFRPVLMELEAANWSLEEVRGAMIAYGHREQARRPPHADTTT